MLAFTSALILLSARAAILFAVVSAVFGLITRSF